jgi:hypothetical protein
MSSIKTTTPVLKIYNIINVCLGFQKCRYSIWNNWDKMILSLQILSLLHYPNKQMAKHFLRVACSTVVNMADSCPDNLYLHLRTMSHTIYAAKFEQKIIHQHVYLWRESQSHALAHVLMRLYPTNKSLICLQSKRRTSWNLFLLLKMVFFSNNCYVARSPTEI